MNKEDMEQFLNVLSIVEGKCPYDLGINKLTKYDCNSYEDCKDCWINSLEKALNE